MKRKELKDTDFKYMHTAKVLGVLKKDYIPHKWKRIGAFDLDYLKEFIALAEKEGEDLSVGIYTHKNGEIAPIHCKGVLLSPIDCEAEVHLRIAQDRREFK